MTPKKQEERVRTGATREDMSSMGTAGEQMGWEQESFRRWLVNPWGSSWP